MGFNRLFDARGFCAADLPRSYQITVTDYADRDEDPDADSTIACEVALNGRGEETCVDFDREHLDAFIAALQEARNHLPGTEEPQE